MSSWATMQRCGTIGVVSLSLGLIRGGYVYRNGDEHLLTDMGGDALAKSGVYPRVEH
jgi:hypothetical protein